MKSAMVATLLLGTLCACGSQLKQPESQPEPERTPFTNELRYQYNLTDDEIKSLQFYVNGSIELTRQLSNTGEKAVTPGHYLRVVKGEAIDEYAVPNNTMGAVQEVEKVGDYTTVLVAFRSAAPEETLLFGSKYTDYGPYKLLGNWENNVGKVNLGEDEYIAHPPSGDAYLEIQLEQIDRLTRRRTEADGFRVPDKTRND